MMLRRRLGRSPEKPPPLLAPKRAIGHQDRDRTGPAGERRDRIAKALRRRLLVEPPDLDIVDFPGRLARDDEPRAALAQLDAIGNVHDAVQHTEAGVADIEHKGAGTNADAGGDTAGGGGFELLAANACVD